MTETVLHRFFLLIAAVYASYVFIRFLFLFLWRRWVRALPGLDREAETPSVLLVILRLFCIGLALFLCSLSFQPNSGPKSKEEETLYGVDFLFLTDVSLSMQSVDTFPTRLIRAKETILRVLPGLTGNRFGMIVFAASPFVYCPMTSDIGTFSDFVRGLDVDMVGDRGTDLEAAFRKAEEMLESNRVFRNRVVVLVTDGEDAQDPGPFRFPADLIVWSVGTTEGGPIAYKDEGAVLSGYLTRDGSLAPYEHSPGVVRTRANEDFLKSLAEANHGDFLSLNRTSPSAEDLKARIRSMDRNATKRIANLRRSEGLRKLLLPAVLLLLFDFFFLEAWGRYGKFLSRKLFMLLLFGFFSISFPVGVSAVELDPGGDRIQEGKQAYEQGNFPNALEKYKEAESYFPGDPRLEYNRGSSRYKSGDLEQSLRNFEKALESKDNSLRSKAYYNLGNIYLQLGDRKRAAENYMRSLKENPKQEVARKNLEWLRKLPPPPQKNGQTDLTKDKTGGSKEKEGRGGASGNSETKEQPQDQRKEGNKNSKSESELEKMMDSLDLNAVKRKSIGSRNREVFW
ncbi:VWA domain-containing protein [Leptospira fletcheri]|uniref:VWA domain-containing protein n=1 Tax=Leptospira fletcheri TaxID=2484981 RepID=A0A4R9GBN1_9LEPT|nr:VWA domain-containing protein [Leptospira fletcheri]TGK09061.1 VWA domain-containing protein [Leptospira fletcheri]